VGMWLTLGEQKVVGSIPTISTLLRITSSMGRATVVTGVRIVGERPD